jgi:hypothetical protein
MSRFTKILSLFLLILFVLACNTITQPLNQAQDLAATAQSIASALPVETLQALATQVATQVPVETLKALPSMAPSLDAVASQIPDFSGFFDPQGTPVSEWRGIPVMSQATAGQEFAESNTYSFKVDATIKEAQEYYTAEMGKLGWTSSFSMPGNETVAVQTFQKDNQFLTVTITEVNGAVVVLLSLNG